MKDKIGFVCVGQAAGNIGDLLAEKGYDVFAINTSQEDIATLKFVKHTYHIPGGLGCSKDRDTAKKKLAECLDDITNQLDTYITEDIIYFIFSAGGGTGSGFSPYFIDILINDVFVEEDEDGELYPTKTIGVITILPADKESPQARENGYNCIKEISEIDGLANVFILDNEGQPKLEAVNKIFVDYLDSVLMIPSRHKSTKGNVDISEIKKGFSTPGISIIARVNSSKATMSDIVNRLKNNVFAQQDLDTDKKAMSYVISSTVNPLDYKTIVAEFGQYVDEFHTFNQDTNIVMLTGLPYPTVRIKGIEERLIKDAQELKNRAARIEDTGIKDELNLLGSAKAAPKRRKPVATATTENAPAKKVSRRDQLLAKMNKR